MKVEKIENEAERARAIVTQVDMICDFATGIMAKVKDLSNKDKTKTQSKESGGSSHEFILIVYNKVQKKILKLNLKKACSDEKSLADEINWEVQDDILDM